MLPSDIRSLYEAYNKIYAPKFETILDEMTDEQVNELTDDLIEEIIEEVFCEYLEEGYEIDDIETVLVESLDNSINALNEEVLMELNPYAPAGSKESGAYNKATTQSKRSAESAAKRAETIEKVKGAVKKVGSKIKQKAAGAAVSAYAAGKMAKGAAKTAGKAALSGAGEAAGKAFKYAKKAGEAVSSGYEKGSKDSGEEESSSSSSTSTPSKPQTQSSQSSGSSGGSIRRAAGSLLKKGVKKVLGLGARAVAGTAKGVHSLADKAAKRLGEEVVDEQNAGPSTPVKYDSHMGQLVPNQGAGRVGAVRLKSGMGLKKGGTVKAEQVSFEIGSGDPNAARKQQKINKAADAGVPNAATKAKGPLLPSSMVKLANSYNPEDIYDLVMEYLLYVGHAETVSEAHYVMSQLDEEMIQSIVEQSARVDYVQDKFDRENAAKSGSALTAIPGKQNTGQALQKAKESARQMGKLQGV